MDLPPTSHLTIPIQTWLFRNYHLTDTRPVPSLLLTYSHLTDTWYTPGTQSLTDIFSSHTNMTHAWYPASYWHILISQTHDTRLVPSLLLTHSSLLSQVPSFICPKTSGQLYVEQYLVQLQHRLKARFTCAIYGIVHSHSYVYGQLKQAGKKNKSVKKLKYQVCLGQISKADGILNVWSSSNNSCRASVWR